MKTFPRHHIFAIQAILRTLLTCVVFASAHAAQTWAPGEKELFNQYVELSYAGLDTEAIPVIKRLIELCENFHGPTDPDTAAALNNLARLYRNTGDYANAEPLFTKSLAICEKVLPPNHPQIAAFVNNLALLYLNMGDYTSSGETSAKWRSRSQGCSAGESLPRVVRGYCSSDSESFTRWSLQTHFLSRCTTQLPSHGHAPG